MSCIRNDPTLRERRRKLRRHQTEAERSLWHHLRNRQFFRLKFRQYSVGPYILDFYCPAASFAVELDGGQHNHPEQKEYDSARTEYLLANGIQVMRFWNNDVLQDVTTVLAAIEENVFAKVKG